MLGANLLANNFVNKIYIVTYFNSLGIAFHDLLSIYGFFIFLTITNQLISGVMLSFSLITETMLVWLDSEEEDLEDLYIDDFFWLHERGVDILFITIYIHLLSNIYLGVCDLEQEDAWNSGVFIFLILQLVVFSGISLSCTHLSDITLTIAANALHTFFLFNTNIYWLIFTDNQLNTDTLIRLTYLHYLSAFFIAYLGLWHGIDMHYDWNTECIFDGINQELSWWDEVILNEFGNFLDFILIVGLFCLFFFCEPEALSYEVFTWGDVGFIVDVSFYGVAPHWYFSPFMAWLVVCPHHYLGIFGLVFFFFIVYFQVNIFGFGDLNFFKDINVSLSNFLIFGLLGLVNFHWSNMQPELDLYWIVTYFVFIISILYVLSFLPYGSFYNRLGGNMGMLLSFMYIYSYLGFLFLRFNWIIFTNTINILN